MIIVNYIKNKLLLAKFRHPGSTFNQKVAVVVVIVISLAPSARFSNAAQSAGVSLARQIELAQSPTRSVALSFDVKRHGFSFSNWAGLTSQDALTYANMARLFGTNASCAEGEIDSSCLLRSGQRLDLSAANSLISSGRCEGMVVLSGLLFTQPQEIKRIDSTVSYAYQLTKESSAKEIAYYSLAQILPEIRSFTSRTLRKPPYVLGQEIAFQIRIKKLVSLGIYGDGFGHSVLPISVNATPRETIITVYDPNFPGEINTLKINNLLGKWTYDRAILADGSIGSISWKGPGRLDFVPLYLRPKN
jgi:hypothetical protein